MIDRNTALSLVVLPLVGLWAVWNTRRLASMGRCAGAWQTAKGIIVESQIVGRGRARSAVVVYAYCTPDRFVGSRICPEGCEDRNPELYLRRYPQGAEVSVYFDPQVPQESYLELPSRRVITAWKILAVIGLCFPIVYLAWIEVLN